MYMEYTKVGFAKFKIGMRVKRVDCGNEVFTIVGECTEEEYLGIHSFDMHYILLKNDWGEIKKDILGSLRTLNNRRIKI